MEKIYKIIIVLIIGLFFLSLVASPASALSIKDAMSNIMKTGTGAGYSSNVTFTDIIALIINALLGLVGIIFFIMIIYGGITWMTAAGNPEKIGKAKKMIISAIIGLAIVTTAYSISYFITLALESNPQ